jgi:beta-lactamase family protein
MIRNGSITQNRPATALVIALSVVLTSCVAGKEQSAPTSPAPAPSTATHQTVVPPSPPASMPSGAATALATEFNELASKLHATMGIVISAVGTHPKQLVFGDWTSGPAWSTSKVPLTITALSEENPPTVTDAIRAAITESDNAAAESIWENLGDPVTAARKVEAVLRKYGDPTTVEWRKVRPEFTAFGQTIWSLSDQARFTAAAVCDSAAAPIFTLMGEVQGAQRWGLGTITDTRFKGGWGPSRTGNYLVRQLGVLKTPTGLTVVAVATEPASGSFNDGIQNLTEVSKWLASHLTELPTAQCGS